MKDVERFILTLKPEPPGRDQLDRDPWYRIRGLLKLALRQFGLRCTCVEVKPAAPSGATAERTLSFPGRAPSAPTATGARPIYPQGEEKATGE